eukprot:TRINITY_DN15822_c0_g1_i1.p1 TRINITY_DN15822_c0_g1~~TRINITY_DN15822_c0_g1_i1.p1  ORF type:complete len:145 (-),score=36.82 TRINITY_DN15822_c0_g1_i1:220-654(-)
MLLARGFGRLGVVMAGASGSAALGAVQAARYHERVIDHYENPRNVGSFPKTDTNVGTGIVGAPACGDVMKVQIKVEDGQVVDAVFKTFGCGSAIASSSLATEWLKGKSLDEAVAIKDKQIAKHLVLPPSRTTAVPSPSLPSRPR